MKSVLITRPQPQASALAAELPAGWQPVVSPLLEIVKTSAKLDLSIVDGLVFTSVNGVRAVQDQLAGCTLPVWCVGKRTAQEVQSLGMQTSVAKGDAGSLEQLILKQRPKGKLLHIRGKHSTGDLCSLLQVQGIDIDDLVVYDQKPLPLTENARTSLRNGGLDAVMLFSPRTALLFSAEVSGIDLRDTRLLCLSKNVSDVLGAVGGARIETASRPDRAAMLELIED